MRHVCLHGISNPETSGVFRHALFLHLGRRQTAAIFAMLTLTVLVKCPRGIEVFRAASALVSVAC